MMTDVRSKVKRQESGRKYKKNDTEPHYIKSSYKSVSKQQNKNMARNYQIANSQTKNDW